MMPETFILGRLAEQFLLNPPPTQDERSFAERSPKWRRLTEQLQGRKLEHKLIALALMVLEEADYFTRVRAHVLAEEILKGVRL